MLSKVSGTLPLAAHRVPVHAVCSAAKRNKITNLASEVLTRQDIPVGNPAPKM
jgi:hypothetical protein